MSNYEELAKRYDQVVNLIEKHFRKHKVMTLRGWDGIQEQVGRWHDERESDK